MTEARTGGCMCGRIRFAFAGPPKFVANCHCAACRKWSGAPMSTWVGGRDDQVAWEGPQRHVFESSPGVERIFCGACGTALAYRGKKWPGETHLMLGVFDAPEAFAPTTDVFTEEGLSWLGACAGKAGS